MRDRRKVRSTVRAGCTAQYDPISLEAPGKRVRDSTSAAGEELLGQGLDRLVCSPRLSAQEGRGPLHDNPTSLRLGQQPRSSRRTAHERVARLLPSSRLGTSPRNGVSRWPHPQRRAPGACHVRRSHRRGGLPICRVHRPVPLAAPHSPVPNAASTRRRQPWPSLGTAEGLPVVVVVARRVGL